MTALTSMTGFGVASAQIDAFHVQVSVRAVNHRGLEARVQLAREWAWLEPRILSSLRERIARGRVELAVELRDTATASLDLGVSSRAFQQAAQTLARLARDSGLPAPTLSDVLRFRDKLGAAPAAPLAQAPIDADAVLGVVAQAIAAFDETRRAEGAALQQVMLAQLAQLDALLVQVQTLRPQLLEAYRARLRARLVEVMDQESISLDPQRLAHEVIVFADRTDVAEEIDRAGAHLIVLRGLLEAEQPEPVGKKIDFYLQEMIRETNTMASKCQSAALTEVIIAMKTLIEQLREQAANVE